MMEKRLKNAIIAKENPTKATKTDNTKTDNTKTDNKRTDNTKTVITTVRNEETTETEEAITTRNTPKNEVKERMKPKCRMSKRNLRRRTIKIIFHK